MASVQELIAAANAQQNPSPLGSTLSNVALGIQQAQQNQLKRAKQLIEIDTMKKQLEAQKLAEAASKATEEKFKKQGIEPVVKTQVGPSGITVTKQFGDDGTGKSTFTPSQLEVVSSGDFEKMGDLFPGGIPEKLAIQAIQGGRNTIVEDPQGNKLLVNRARNIAYPLASPDTQPQGTISDFDSLSPLKQKRVLAERDKFSSDKVIQELDQRIGKANEMAALIKANPANAYGLLAGALTRFAGEVGRLTDEDIDRNIKPRDAASRVKQTLKLIKDGKFPKERLEEMSIIFDIVNKSAAKTFNKKLDNAVGSTKKIVGDVDEDLLRETIGGRSLLYEPVSNIDNLSKTAEERFNELEDQGMSKPDIYQQLRKEGY